jgi:hypothetical protein
MGDNKKLYDVLVKVPSLKGASTLKDFNTFNSAYSSDESRKKLFDVLNKVPELKGASTLSDFNNFKSSYFLQPKEEKGFFSKAVEGISKTLAPNIPGVGPVLGGFFFRPFFDLLPNKEEKKKTVEGLKTLPPSKPSIEPEDPVEKIKFNYDKVVNPFLNFRKYVPDPTGQSDSLSAGNDISKLKYGYNELVIDNEGLKTKVTEIIDPSPENLQYGEFQQIVRDFSSQAKKRISSLDAEKKAKIDQINKQYPEKSSSVIGLGVPIQQPNKQGEIKKIEDEYNKKIKDVQDSYNDLNENVFGEIDFKLRNQEQLKYLGDISDENVDKTIEKLNRAKSFLANSNKTDQVYRKRNYLVSTIKSQNLGEDQEKIEKDYEKYVDFPEVSPNYVTRTNLEKEKKEYTGAIEALSLNKSFLNSYIQNRNKLSESLKKEKEKFEKNLQEKIFSKGYTLEDLEPKSLEAVNYNKQHFKKLEKVINLYDQNIKLLKQEEGIISKDISSFTDLINYKAEQDKINRLYEESPYSTFLTSFPVEVGKRLKSSSQTVSFANILMQKKLGNLSKEDAELYKNILEDIPKEQTYVQKLVLDEESGQMVYKNLKDVEAISIVDKEGKFKPVGEWVQNADALVYTILNTTAESFAIGLTGSVYRKLMYTAGEKLAGSMLAETALKEAIDKSAVGLSKLDKAKLLTMKGIEKGATWSANVTSMLPATTVLYSPEIINREIEKGLSVEDVAVTAGLRLLAENVAENLFFDDVKFVDNLLKKGTIKNYRDLETSEAYRILMDKISISTVGRRLSDFEYKALFTGKNLKKLLSKENMEYILKRSIPKRAKYLGEFAAYSTEASALESGEEVSTNVFNTLIDNWRKSEDETYEADQEFTFENQINTVAQTMASMLLLGATQGYKRTSERASERRFNVDLAAYQVSISPDIFKENLYNQFIRSQSTKNPMSEDELNLRMSEFDRLHQVYKSLGFSEEKTKENIKLQMDKLTEGKEIDDVLKKEIEKQAEREVRNTEFQMFRDALTKSQLENEFLAAKTDKEKEKILNKINQKFEEIEKLKEDRRKQKENLINERNKLIQKDFSEERANLSRIVENIDQYISTLNTLDDVDKAIETISSYNYVTDKDINNYAEIIVTALKNREYELISKGETRLSPEELRQKREFENNNFTEKEKRLIDLLQIDLDSIAKVDGKIQYNYEGEQIEFENLKQLKDFTLKKVEEKEKELQLAEERRIENQQLSDLQDYIGEAGNVYKTNEGKFIFESPSGKIEFENINDLSDYVFKNQEDGEELGEIVTDDEIEQKNLEAYEAEVDEAYEEYKKGKKRPLTKDQWLNTKQAKKKLLPTRQKYNIGDTGPISEENLANTYLPLITEFDPSEINEINIKSNIKNLPSTTILYQGDKLVNASNLIAYQARTIEEKVQVDENQAVSVIKDASNELNNEFLFMHSPEFLSGQELEVVIKPLETSTFSQFETETLLNNSQALINQGISQNEINDDIANEEMFQEIQLFTKDGKYVGTLHSLSYIRPSRVAEYLYDKEGNTIPNLAPNYKALKNLRSSIISAAKNNKKITVLITGKNIGHLSIRKNNELLPLSEAFENKEVLKTITILTKNSTLTVNGKETINEGFQGSTSISVTTPNNKQFLLSLNKQKLQDPQIDSFINAMLLHTKYIELSRKEGTEEVKEQLENIELFIDSINEQTGYDIRTAKGLKEYMNLFVNVYSKTSDYYGSAQKEQLRDVKFIDVSIDKNGYFNITFSNSRDFNAFDEDATIEKNYDNIGIYRLYTSDILNNTEKFKEYIPLLVDHLRNRTVNHDANLLNKLGKFNLPYIRKTNLASNPFAILSQNELDKFNLKSSYPNYKDYLISTSVTPILETKLPDGKYTYFQQPNFTFSVEISEPSVPEKPKEKKKAGKQKTLFEQETKPEETTAIDKLKDVESTAKQKLDPDLVKIDQTLIDARNGDKEAQRLYEEMGLDWEQTTTYRFVGQSEVDVLLANEKVESKRGMADNGIDVTSSPKVTTAANNEHRVTFKESFDKNNGLGKVRKKNETDSNLEKGRGYDINDVAKIERLDENGNVVEIIYDSESLLSKEEAPVTTDTKADIEKRRQELESSREIEMLYDLRKPITEDSKETISKINEANRLREQAKNKSDQAQKETDEDTRIALNNEAQSLNEKAQIVDKEIKASRDNVIESTPIKQAISSAKILGQRLLTKIKLASKSNEWVSSMPISKEDFIKLEDATKRLSVKNMGEVTSNSEVIPDILLVEEINAKYDAELEALKGKKEEKETKSIEEEEKQEIIEQQITEQQISANDDSIDFEDFDKFMETSILEQEQEYEQSEKIQQIMDAYNDLTNEQKEKNGTLQEVIDKFTNNPIPMDINDYIESLKC